ncbi:ankyrin repeat domain-containing protein [Wolbachia pipientis]|uniref:ankyrin repeat domain-containing protein n=1 Tax=Wolbachia pipientis TaxID=955 RepID=UPI0020B78A91|nr:ankyrin repeat domain-containing protein [Wolbachia pipientis]
MFNQIFQQTSLNRFKRSDLDQDISNFPDIFSRRTGTQEGYHGYQYEVGLSMLYLLRGLKLGSDFRLGSNVDGIGASDDIVFLYSANQKKKRLVVVQAKHRNKLSAYHNIIFSDLFISNGKDRNDQKKDFGLEKYFKSYLDIKKSNKFKDSDITVIIHTNVDLNLKKECEYRNEKISLENYVKKIKLPDDNILNIGKGTKDTYYKIKHHDELIKYFTNSDEVKDFLSALRFAVNQPNQSVLDPIIKNEIKEIYKISDSKEIDMIFGYVRYKVEKWWERKGNVIKYLNKKDDYFKEAITNLKNLELTALFWEYRDKTRNFDLEFIPNKRLLGFLDSDSKEQIFNIISKQSILSSIRAYQTFRTLGKYKEDSSYIFMSLSSILSSEQLVIDAFESRDLLVIECKEEVKNTDDIIKLHEKLKKIISKASDKKIILITEQQQHALVNLFSIPDKDREDERINFIDLTDKAQERLPNEKIMFQGEEVTLGSIIEINDEESKRLIDGKVLSELIELIFNKNDIVVGSKLPDLGNIYRLFSDEFHDRTDDTIHVDRILIRKVNLKDDFRNDNRFLIVEENVDQDLSTQQNKDITLVYEDDTKGKVKNRFNELKLPKGSSAHLIKKENGQYIWQETRGSVSNLRQYVSEQHKFIEEIEENKLCNTNDKVVIISAEPGMGKSETLTHLSKESNKNGNWVIGINLKDCREQIESLSSISSVNIGDIKDKDIVIRKIVETLSQSGTDKGSLEDRLKEKGKIVLSQSKLVISFDGFDEIDSDEQTKVNESLQSLQDEIKKDIVIKSMVKFLSSVDNEGLSQGLSKALLEYRLKTQGKLIISFDGFDEIDLDEQIKVVEFLKSLKDETKVDKIFVTTRQDALNILEDKLGVFSYNLNPLARERDGQLGGQEKLLSTLWQESLKEKLSSSDYSFEGFISSENGLKKCVKILLKNFPEEKGRTFTDIPLHLVMAAYVTKHDIKNFYDDYKKEGNENINKNISDYFKKFKELNLLSLYEEFVRMKYDFYFNKYLKDDFEYDKIKGIKDSSIKSLNEAHQNLALSYDILFPFNQVKDLIKREESITFKDEQLSSIGIIYKVNNKFSFVHKTFGEYFAAARLATLAVRLPKSKEDRGKRHKLIHDFLLEHIFKKENEVIRHFFDLMLAKDKNGENKYAIHNAALNNDIKKVKSLLEKDGSIINTTDRGGRTPLHLAAAYGYYDIVEILLENKDVYVSATDNIFGWKPLDYADKANHLLPFLDLAIRRDKENIVDILVGHLKDEEPDRNIVNILVGYLREEEPDRLTQIVNKKYENYPNYNKYIDKYISTVSDNKEQLEKIFDTLSDFAAYGAFLGESSDESLEEGCLTSSSESSSERKRREISSKRCLFTWKDVDEFSVEKEDKRDISKLRINSDKFIDYIKDESISENKRTQLIQLAEQVPITGQSQGLVHKLISNQKFINHLSRVGKISGMTMQVMMAKNVLADAVNGNYQGLAINLGFIVLPFGVKAGENAALKGLHSASEIAYARGFKLAPLVESSLAQYFKVSSSFLARSTSAFIAYDLVKELRNGTKEALVGVVGDSVYLGVDAAELGIEVAEGFGVLEGVSSVTGPIGATIGAVVFVGTDVYQAVKKVENIDRLVHLTAEERFLEGIRAFIGIGTERHIEELIEKKQLYNQLVKQALEYLKQHNDIQRYVFPTGKLVQDTCNIVQYKEQCPSPDVHSDFMVMPGEPTGLGIRNACHKDANGNLFILKEREECITKFKPDSNNMVILDEQKPDIKWSKIRPNNPPEGNLFCIPQGHGNLAPGLAYSCNNAIGVEYSSNRTDNYTFIDLGDGTDLGIGFNNSSNIFLIGNGYKTIHGGEKDDTFILQGNRFEGKIFGRNGANTLDLSKFSPQSKSLFLRFHGNNLSTLGGLIDQISKVITRENKEDIISCKDVTLKYIDGRGGRNENEQDVITIEFDYCHKLFGTTIDCRDYLSGKFTPKVQIMLRDYTTVNNYASKGNFSYFVDQKEGKASVDILSTSKNEFIFNNTLEDIKAINFNSSNVVDRGTIKFTFLPHNTEALISYKLKGVSFILNDGTAISVSKEGNLYALQNSNKSVDEIINSYSRVANNLKMSIFVHSLLNNESIVVGHGKHDVIENNPEYKSHLIGNGGENIFVVTSDKLPIPEIVLYDVDQENKIDTLDLRKIRKQVESDLNVKIKTRIITSGKDLIVQLFYEKDNEVSESNIVQVRLKNGLLTNWYERLHVIMNHVPMKIEEFELRPLPLVFDNNEEIIRIAAEDVDKNNKVIISQKVEDYTFSKLGNDLIMTFNHNASLILSEFYKNKEMETLTIRFANKEVAIKDELNNVRSFDDLKEEYKNSTASIINSFNTTEASNSIEASNSTETRVEPLKRNRRNVESNAKSAASRPASFVNTIVNAFTNAIIGTVQGIISARTSAGYSSSSADDKPSNYKSSVNGYKPEGTANSISQVDAKMDVNGTIMLFDLLIRKVTGQKYISTVDQSISPLEAQGYALNITNRFEKVLNKTAIKSGISLTHLNLDPVAVQSAIVRKIINGRFSEIAKTLYSFAKEACPEYKQTDKFLVHLRSQLEGEKVLQQKVEKPYKDLSQEVSRKVELSKKPDTFLNGTSVVKGISRGIN